MLALFRRDARALISDANLDAVLPRRDRDNDLSVRRRVAHGVLEHVGQHLIDLNRIDPDRRRIGPDHRSNGERREGRLHARQHRLHDVVERHELLRRDERAGANAGEVQQVADQAVQPVRLLEHRAEQLLLLTGVVHDPLLEQAGHAGFDRRERRAQVVRHGREERRADLARLRVEARAPRFGVEARALQCKRGLRGQSV